MWSSKVGICLILLAPFVSGYADVETMCQAADDSTTGKPPRTCSIESMEIWEQNSAQRPIELMRISLFEEAYGEYCGMAAITAFACRSGISLTQAFERLGIDREDTEFPVSRAFEVWRGEIRWQLDNQADPVSTKGLIEALRWRTTYLRLAPKIAPETRASRARSLRKYVESLAKAYRAKSHKKECTELELVAFELRLMEETWMLEPAEDRVDFSKWLSRECSYFQVSMGVDTFTHGLRGNSGPMRRMRRILDCIAWHSNNLSEHHPKGRAGFLDLFLKEIAQGKQDDHRLRACLLDSIWLARHGERATTPLDRARRASRQAGFGFGQKEDAAWLRVEEELKKLPLIEAAILVPTVSQIAANAGLDTEFESDLSEWSNVNLVDLQWPELIRP